MVNIRLALHLNGHSSMLNLEEQGRARISVQGDIGWRLEADRYHPLWMRALGG